MKIKKQIRLTSVIIVLVLLLAGTAYARANIPKPTGLFYAADFADVLTKETVQHIVTVNDALYAKTGAQVVVATVDFTGGSDIADYAYEMFNEWKIGSKEKNNGVLLLLSIGEDNYYCMQGKGLENELTGGMLDDLMFVYLEPDFAAGKYDEGVAAFFDALVGKLEKIYAVDIDAPQPDPDVRPDPDPVDPILPDPDPGPEPADPEEENEGLSNFWKTMILILVILLILSFAVRHGGYGGGFGFPRTVFYSPRPHYSSNSRPSRPSGSSCPSRPSGGSRPRGGGGGSSRGGGAGRRR